MVQYLTKQGIGTFQVLILRGTCQAADQESGQRRNRRAETES